MFSDLSGSARTCGELDPNRAESLESLLFFAKAQMNLTKKAKLGWRAAKMYKKACYLPRLRWPQQAMLCLVAIELASRNPAVDSRGDVIGMRERACRLDVRLCDLNLAEELRAFRE